MADAIATSLGRVRQLLHAGPLFRGQFPDPLQEFRELLLEGLFIHVVPLFFVCRNAANAAPEQMYTEPEVGAGH